jgi:hypothetical protein
MRHPEGREATRRISLSFSLAGLPANLHNRPVRLRLLSLAPNIHTPGNRQSHAMGKLRKRLPMRITFRQVVCAFSLCLAAASVALSQTQELTPDLKAFATQYVAAINAKDEARLLSLYSAQSRACIAAEDKDFYQTTLHGFWREPIPPSYTATASAVNENNLKAIETLATFAVHPARELHIDHQEGDDVSSIDLYLIRENSRWVVDQPCPTADTIKQFHDGAADRAHYKAVAQSIQDPLRSELIGLLRRHESASAIDRYHQATGQDMQTSMFVVNALQDQIP